MNRNFRIILMAVFLITAPLLLLAQSPPHPNGGAAPGTGNGPVGGGAPIDGGISFLVIMGIGYGAKKVISIRKNEGK